MKTISSVWPEWQIEKEIGRGSYGTVYKCFKEEKGKKEYSAVKVISVPRSEYEMSEVASEKMTNEQSKAYYKDVAYDLFKEIEILKALKGTKNIVEIYDAEIVEKDDGIGWYILIRMELLTDFNTYSSDKKFTEAEVIKLGIDLCNALSVCHKARIIHRDVKPENIFVDAEGNYKLGDFGVAKQLEKTQGSMSVKGTYDYMSPEVFGGKKGDGRADLYSLAIVMYKLLNNNRLPFLDPDKQLIRYSERQTAFEKRIKGEELPAIKNVSKELNAIILRACAFKYTDRQKNIDIFRTQLKKLSDGKKKVNKAITKLIIAIVVIFLSFILTVAAIKINENFRDVTNNAEKIEEVSSKEQERVYSQVTTLSSVMSEYQNENGKYLIFLGDEENPNQLYVDLTNKTFVNLYEKYDIEETNSICMIDEKTLYFVEYKDSTIDTMDKIGYSVYSCDLISEEKKLLFTREDTCFSTLVYCDDEYIYFEEWEDTTSEQFLLGPTNLKSYNLKDGTYTTIAHGTTYSFVHKGYIICTTDASGWYVLSPLWIYDTISKKLNLISEEALTMDEIYIDGDEIYFRETFSTVEDTNLSYYENNNIQISKYNISAKKKEVVSNLAESGMDFSAETGATYCFNDKYAVLHDNNGESVSIWSFNNKNQNSINWSSEEENSYNHDCFTDKTVSENLLYIDREGYGYKLYEILSSGEVMQLGNEIFIAESENNLFQLGAKFISANSANKTIKIYDFFEEKSSEKVEYTECNETVYAKSGVNIRIGPDSKYKSLGILNKGTCIERIAIGSNGWSKVVYDGAVVYISSAYLDVLKPTEEDFENIISTASAMVYCFDVEEFNCESDEAFDDAINYILDSAFGVYEYYNNYFGWNKKHSRIYQENIAGTESYKAEDPLKKFDSSYAYAKFPADKVEWILENVYNQSVDRSQSSHWYYYHNGYYYAETGDGGDVPPKINIDDYELNDNEYTFDLSVKDTFSDEIKARYKAVVKISSINGTKYWNIKSLKLNQSKEALLYKEFLTSNYSNDSDKRYYVYDLNNDAKKELIISNHNDNGKTKCEVFSIVNTKVVGVGSFTFKGNNLYESLIHTLCYSLDYEEGGYDIQEGTQIKTTMVSLNDGELSSTDYSFKYGDFNLNCLDSRYVYDYYLLRY